MYETYPKKPSAGKAGKKSGWKDGFGDSYPDKKPTKEDDHHKVVCNLQIAGSGSPAPKTFPKHKGYSNMFPALQGLPR